MGSPNAVPFWEKTRKLCRVTERAAPLASGIWASSPGAPPTQCAGLPSGVVYQCAGLPSGVVYQCAGLPVALLPWNFAVEL